VLKPYFLLTNRSVLAVVNVGENDLDRIPEHEARVRAEFTSAGDNVEVIGMCVQLEAEAATIVDPVERAEMLEGFGLGEGALFRMVRSAYHLLGMRTYLTTGEKETRAWTFYAGSSAPECAGRIHTDFQRGFIKAEVIHWDELLEIGSGPRPRSWARSASRARTTTPSTATSWSSASTCSLSQIGRQPLLALASNVEPDRSGHTVESKDHPTGSVDVHP
jgi:ribosome-binding ATPase YchF (GTP1/OBG family)